MNALTLLLLLVMSSIAKLPDNRVAPSISRITPGIVVYDDGQIVPLHVAGGGFTADAKIRWNGQDRPTTLDRYGELRTTLSGSDLNPGRHQITVYVPGPPAMISNSVEFIVQAPQAVITSISPTSGIAGGEPFTMTITGRDLAPGAYVWWGSHTEHRSATFVSGSQLTLTVPSSDLTPGRRSLHVMNPGPGGGLSGAIDFHIAHAVPVISTLNPSKVRAYGTSFPLAIIGQNFIRNTSIVRWNGSDRPTVFVSPTQLSATVNGADVANPGTATVSVFTQVGSSSQTSAGASLVIAPAPNSIQAITPVNQQGTAGAPVSQSPAVVVRDRNNNPLDSVPVGFAVTHGGGRITPTRTLTDVNGVARSSSWTLDSKSGTNTATAFTGNLSPVTFTATSPFTLIVFVKRPDGSGLDRAQVCVGTTADVDQYATVKSASSSGRAIFTLPAQSKYNVTAAMAGYAGKSVEQNASGSSVAVTLTLAGGTGGPTCPGMQIIYDATTSTGS